MGCKPSSQTPKENQTTAAEPEKKPKQANLAGGADKPKPATKDGFKGEDLINPAKIKQTWDIYDFNKNGKLSLAEIDKALVELFPQYGAHKPVLMRSYIAADASKDGFIEYTEFENLVKLLSYYETLFQQFKHMDKNADHRVSFEEFKAGFSQLGFANKSEVDLKAAFDKIDVNHGGFVLFDEFCTYMAKEKQVCEKPKVANLAGPAHTDKPAEKKENRVAFKGEDLIDPAKIKQTWDIYDYNKNGKLSLAEIDKALVELFPQYGEHKPVLLRSYYAADLSQDGFIQFSEFENLIKLLTYYEKMFVQFKHLDKNSDHRIAFSEFKQAHTDIGIAAKTDEELKAEFDKLDTNKGGFVLFDEFCSYMARQKK